MLPGLSYDALDLLKERSTKANAKGSELNVTLVMDEISIRKGYSWDGAKTWGQVDLGDGILEEDAPLAKEVLVFMVVSVDLSFKLPIGFYFIAGLKADRKAELVRRYYIIEFFPQSNKY